MTFSLTILGSSSSLPTSARFTSSQLLTIQQHQFLIDCGEGTQIRMRHFKIAFRKINHIFISHLHGDHFFGLPGLISSYSILGRTSDLHIYGPADLEKIIQVILLPVKREHEKLPFSILFHPLNFSQPEKIFENRVLTVESFPLKHKIPVCGFLFREKPKLRKIKKECIEKYNIPVREIAAIKEGGDFVTPEGSCIHNKELTIDPPHARSFAYCSDTAYNEKIIPLIANIDLLYHEATFTSDLKDRADETCHSTASQAAMIARQAGVKKLLIGHFSTRYKDIAPLLQEAKEVFPDTLAADDGMTVTIN